MSTWIGPKSKRRQSVIRFAGLHMDQSIATRWICWLMKSPHGALIAMP